LLQQLDEINYSEFSIYSTALLIHYSSQSTSKHRIIVQLLRNRSAKAGKVATIVLDCHFRPPFRF